MMRRLKDFRHSWDYNVTEKVSANFYPVNYANSISEKQVKFYSEKIMNISGRRLYETRTAHDNSK